MDSGKLLKMLERVKDQNLAIDNITIVRNGYIVTDAYLYPFQKNAKHVIHSNTKSITATLVGIAKAKGYIESVNQSVLEFFPEKTIANLDDRKRSITLEHLLTMTAGLDSQDTYLYQWVGLGEMMAGEDWSQYVLDLPMAQEPGAYFEYSNGVSYLLSAIIQRATGVTAAQFAEQHLFKALGIVDVHWPANPQGVSIGWGEMMLTPHDMAKIGLLYLNRGYWEDKQVVPAAWVDASTKKHVAATLFDGYGYQWWVNSTDYYMAVGYQGQFIFVVPDTNMVVVFTSNNLVNDDFFAPQKLLEKYILPASISSHEIAAQPGKEKKLAALLLSLQSMPENGYKWASKPDGLANNGEFHFKTSPAFRFNYPKSSTKKSCNTDSQVMAMKTPVGSTFSASIKPIPAGAELAQVGIEDYVKALETYGSKIQVVANKQITLKDGTLAYRTDIDWQWRSSFMLRTLLVSAFKDGQWVSVTYNMVASNKASIPAKLNEGESIVESLRFL